MPSVGIMTNAPECGTLVKDKGKNDNGKEKINQIEHNKQKRKKQPINLRIRKGFARRGRRQQFQAGGCRWGIPPFLSLWR